MKNKRGQIQQPMEAMSVEVGQPVKKYKWWLWLIIALGVIGVGIGVYFLLGSGGMVGGGSGPSPPAFPA